MSATPLQQVIDAVLRRRGQFFSLTQLTVCLSLPRKNVYRALQRLVREGHVVRYRSEQAPPTWRKGRPGLGRVLYGATSSLKLRKAAREGYKQPDTAWDKAWTAMRVMRCFTKKDVRITAGITDANLRWFLKQLRHAGIARPTAEGGPGVRWQFISDLGPRRPSWAEIKRLQNERRNG